MLVNRIFKAAIVCFGISALVVGCSSSIKTRHAAPYIPVQKDLKNKKLALVLGGGGAKGFAHVGVIEELEKAGIVPDVIIGCSAGAIVGAMYASDPDSAHLKEQVFSGKKSDIFTRHIKDFPYGIYSKEQFRGYLEKTLQKQTFSDLDIPLVVTATNLEFGNTTVFTEGDLVDPILASAALPGAFSPVKIQDQYFVDCGVADPIPVSVAQELGVDTIIAVDVSEKLPDSMPNHAAGVIQRSIEIAYMNRCNSSREAADVIIDFEFKDIGVMSDKHNEYLYEEGRKAGREAVRDIKNKLKEKNA